MIRILNGDCREVMAGMEPASVDAIVCDPPYGLEFMGKEWDAPWKQAGESGGKRTGFGEADGSKYRQNRGTPSFGVVGNPTCLNCGGDKYRNGPRRCACGAPRFPNQTATQMRAFQAWCEEWAEQCLRVLKPGGHLLAFSGTRTYHRMVCAIEDAGFEIRDQLQWIYAAGFPKSRNLDNERGGLICGCDDQLHGMRQGPNDAAIGAREGEDAELQPAMQRRASGPRMGDARLERCDRTQDIYADARPEEPGLEGRSDPIQEEGQLRQRALCTSAGMGAADGSEGWLPHGSPAGDGRVVRLSADADGGCASRQPPADGERAVEPRTLAGQPQPQARGAWPNCGRCGLPVLPRGLGTALKPANEPIVLARKPLVGTVAANVLAHGTGALNIDGCRISAEPGDTVLTFDRHAGARDREQYRTGTVGNAQPSTLGRWPANIIHDGSEEVLAAFPQTVAATSRSGAGWRSEYVGGEKRVEVKTAVYQDGGGSAARFFYTAKASAHDRNDGCEGLPMKVGGMVSNTSGQHITRRDGGAPGPRANHHPTVKPTDLMRYLCRLVTPPGGTVLDPFMGSGSTLKAAELEGFSAIGIELDPAYIEIARRRIASDAPLFADVA